MAIPEVPRDQLESVLAESLIDVAASEYSPNVTGKADHRIIGIAHIQSELDSTAWSIVSRMSDPASRRYNFSICQVRAALLQQLWLERPFPILNEKNAEQRKGILT